MCYVCVFKQKTAYGVRISDWSSDVCSSDLGLHQIRRLIPRQPDLLINRFGQLSTGYGLPRHSTLPQFPRFQTVLNGSKPVNSKGIPELVKLLRQRRVLAPGKGPLPTDQRRPPGESTAHRSQGDEIVTLDATIRRRRRERQREDRKS